MLNDAFINTSENRFTAKLAVTSATSRGAYLGKLTLTAGFNELDASEITTLMLRSSVEDLASELANEMNGAMPDATSSSMNVDHRNFAGVTDRTFYVYFVGFDSLADERMRIARPGAFLVSVFPGDYKDDGMVNVADYAVWSGNPSAGQVTRVQDANAGAADGNAPKHWRSNNGARRVRLAFAEKAAVPEPAPVCTVAKTAAAASAPTYSHSATAAWPSEPD